MAYTGTAYWCARCQLCDPTEGFFRLGDVIAAHKHRGPPQKIFGVIAVRRDHFVDSLDIDAGIL